MSTAPSLRCQSPGRTRPAFRPIVLPVVLVGAVAIAAWHGRPQPLRFAASFEAALVEAAAGGSFVVLHLRRSDRPLGAEMDAATLRARALELDAHDGFVHLKLDADREPELAARLAGPRAALATLVVDAAGELVARRDGFLDAAELAAWLAAVRAAAPRLRELGETLARTPKEAAARVELGERLAALGAGDRSEREWRRALVDAAADDGDRSRALLTARIRALLARLLAERGQVAAARASLDDFRTAVAAAPLPGGNPRGVAAAAELADLADLADLAALAAAVALHHERRDTEAAQALRGLAARYPPSPSADEARRLLAEWKLP